MKGLRMLYVLVIASVLLAACNNDNNDENAEEEVVVSVETAQVEEGDLKVSKSSFGRVSLVTQTPVMADGPAEVKEVHVTNGDEVKEDDKLVTIKTPQGDLDIKAPEDGQVAKLSLREGDYTSDEDPLAIIVDLDEVEAVFDLTKKTRDLLKVDKKVNLTYQEESLEGKVLPFDILPGDTGQYEVKVEIDNEDRILSPGDVVSLEIVEDRVKDTLFVPTAAIITEDDDSYVFIVEDDLAKKVEVEIVELQSDLTAIKGELEEADAVIVSGHFTLEDGDDVQVEKEGK